MDIRNTMFSIKKYSCLKQLLPKPWYVIGKNMLHRNSNNGCGTSCSVQAVYYYALDERLNVLEGHEVKRSIPMWSSFNFLVGGGCSDATCHSSASYTCFIESYSSMHEVNVRYRSWCEMVKFASSDYIHSVLLNLLPDLDTSRIGGN